MSSNSEDSVRSPDPVICERLLPADSVFSFAPIPPDNDIYDLDKAIQASLGEYEKEVEKREADLLELMEMEAKVRSHRFASIKKYITRMIALDAINKSVYETFYNYIYLYETEHIDYFVVEPVYYHDLFKLMSSSRLSKEDIANCKQLIRLL